VPKAMIQAVLFRELICIGTDDIAADLAVRSGKRSDSSTGLGQITAKTAMAAHNPDNLTLSQMWELLQTPEKNIEYVGHILKYEAKKQKITELNAITDEQRINIFGAYNAGPHYASDDGRRYGEATQSYYNEFVKYLRTYARKSDRPRR